MGKYGGLVIPGMGNASGELAAGETAIDEHAAVAKHLEFKVGGCGLGSGLEGGVFRAERTAIEHLLTPDVDTPGGEDENDHEQKPAPTMTRWEFLSGSEVIAQCHEGSGLSFR
jgi:hypothetical protein